MITIDVDDKSLQNELNKLKAKYQDLTGLMRILAEDLLYSTQENFNTQGARLPAGDNWPSLSDWTLKERAKRGHGVPPGKMLQDTGILIGSLTTSYDATSAVCGTNIIYAAIQHFGGGPTGLNTFIPPRPFMELIDQDLDDMMEDVMSYLGK
jgi:phage virion morphogenesis protein